MGESETVGGFYNPAIDQIKFAAEDVKTALESKKFTVEMLDIKHLNSSYANKKVIVALS